MKNVDETRTKEQLASLLHVSPKEIVNLLARIDRFYRAKPIPKSNGRIRTLLIPMGRLLLVQSKILEHIFGGVSFPKHLHGGIKHKSNITNARVHSNKTAVLKFDIKDYFPSVRPAQILLVFESLGFYGEAAAILTRLTTFRHQLPQGSPTSTALANLAFSRGDARLLGIARKHNFDFTRYVDDSALSGGSRVGDFSNLARRIVEEEGFEIKGNTPELMRQSERQTLTGIGLNFKLNVSRERREEVLTHAASVVRSGELPTRQLEGKLAWLSSVNPNLGKRIGKQLKARRQKAKQVWNEASRSRHRNNTGNEASRGDCRRDQKTVA